MKQNQPQTSTWEWLGYAIPGELVLILLPVILGVWGLICLFRFLADVFRESPSRRLVATGLLIFATDVWAALGGNPVGHLLAAALTLLAWSRCRSSRA